MPIEAWSIVIYGLLIFLVVAFQGGYQSATETTEFGFSNRETPSPNKGAMGHRIDRTLDNLKEGALMYVPLALLAVHFGISNSFTFYAALMTIMSRIAYVPIYVFGVTTIRTFVWAPSFLAIPLLVYGIFLGLPQ